MYINKQSNNEFSRQFLYSVQSERERVKRSQSSNFLTSRNIYFINDVHSKLNWIYVLPEINQIGDRAEWSDIWGGWGGW